MSERVQAVEETGTDPFPLTEADQADLKLTGGLYPYPNRRLEVSVDDRSFVGVAALRMSAATVLRMVLLRKAVEVAQSSAYVRIECAFKGWFWFVRRTLAERQGYYTGVLQGIFHSLWWEWAFCHLWRRWAFSVRVRRVERMVRKWDAERVGGATRQWLSNWCNEFEEAATRAIATERAAEAIKVKAAAMAKAMGAVKAKAAEGWTWADRAHQSEWNSVVCQLCEMMDILAECRMQKLD